MAVPLEHVTFLVNAPGKYTENCKLILNFFHLEVDMSFLIACHSAKDVMWHDETDGSQKYFPVFPEGEMKKIQQGNTSNISQILHEFFKLPYVSKHHKCIKSQVTTERDYFQNVLVLFVCLFLQCGEFIWILIQKWNIFLKANC